MRVCMCVCVRHLNGKAAAAAVDLKFFYHICQIRIYASLLCSMMGECVWECVYVYLHMCVLPVCSSVCVCGCLFCQLALTFISNLRTSGSRLVSYVICKYILINLIKFHEASINEESHIIPFWGLFHLGYPRRERIMSRTFYTFST